MNSTRALIRAIRGPIVLITLGTLFVVDFFGSSSFWRTWPVLLIVIGALCLLERIVPDSDPGPGPAPGGTS
jgi:hypothetical protein